MSAQAPLILGTAGHIDHGKTALIRALTGVNTDRLPEERERGISIELGYARVKLPSGRSVSVIDVPGHERFVRTMVAGITGVDLYLLAIAADDGVMPQTREHAAVLRALKVERGVVAVTKSDLMAPESALLEARALMPEAEFVAVSARTGEGLGELRAALERVVAAVPTGARDAGAPRLHVDRVFTIRGAGTVATGTLWSGSLLRGQEVEVLPQNLRTRIRAIQVHDQAVDACSGGQRVALNLTGVRTGELSRGDVITTVGSALSPTYRLDGQLAFEQREPAHGERVQVHHGTRESPARLAWLGGPFWQLRLQRPMVAACGDRLVVRQIAPPDTLGGGVVVDPAPLKHGPSRELLVRLQARAAGEPAPQPSAQPRRKEPDGPAEPERPPELSKSALALERRLLDAQLEPPVAADLDPRDLSALRAAGRAVRVSKTLHYHPATLAEVKARVLELAEGGGGMITLGQLRDELQTSRRFAHALLEHLDAERVTIRRGDVHYLRKGPTAASAD